MYMEPQIQNEQKEEVIVTSKKKEFINLPVALIIVVIIIVGAFLTKTKTDTKEPENTLGEVVPVLETDYVQGSIDSPITIIEYSDTDCPYCQKFHQTMENLMIMYPGKIRWVYRMFPLETIHENSRQEAIASICVAKLGGNDKFWIYTDKMFTIDSSGDPFQLIKLPIFAKELGIDETAFNTCIKSDEATEVLEQQIQMGVKAKVKGTPLSIVIINKTGEQIPVFGAKSTEQMKEAIDAILK